MTTLPPDIAHKLMGTFRILDKVPIRRDKINKVRLYKIDKVLIRRDKIDKVRFGP